MKGRVLICILVHQKSLDLKKFQSIKLNKNDQLLIIFDKISFKFDNGVFVGKCIIYSNDYKIKTQKNREDSKILIKISVPVL